MTVRFILNQTVLECSEVPFRFLLDFIRTEAGLKGTKSGCREGDCGACSVLVGRLKGKQVEYQVVNSCLFPIERVNGCHVVTIEGLNVKGLNQIQRLIVEEGATQCGFCTPGLVLSLTGYLLDWAGAFDQNVASAVAGNICRCTGYASIRRVAHRLENELSQTALSVEQRFAYLYEADYLPGFFRDIAGRLEQIGARLPVVQLGPGQMIVSGGTDYFIQHSDPGECSDLCYVDQEACGQISLDGDELVLGGAVTVEELLRSKAIRAFLPGLEQSLGYFASPQIRKVGTLAGNIVNASPIGDLAIMFLACQTTIGLTCGPTTRTLPLEHFFVGYKKLDLKPGEMVTWFKIHKPARTLFHFEKVSKRTHLDIASVNTALTLDLDDQIIRSGRLSAGGVAPVPLFLKKASALLSERKLCVETARELAQAASQEISPIDDVRGSSWYKRTLLHHLVLAHFRALFNWEEGLL